MMHSYDDLLRKCAFCTMLLGYKWGKQMIAKTQANWAEKSACFKTKFF